MSYYDWRLVLSACVCVCTCKVLSKHTLNNGQFVYSSLFSVIVMYRLIMHFIWHKPLVLIWMEWLIRCCLVREIIQSKWALAITILYFKNQMFFGVLSFRCRNTINFQAAKCFPKFSSDNPFECQLLGSKWFSFVRCAFFCFTFNFKKFVVCFNNRIFANCRHCTVSFTVNKNCSTFNAQCSTDGF